MNARAEGLREAVRLLTVLPAGTSAVPAPPSAAVAWYGAVGLGLGGLVALVAFAAWELFPPLLAAALTVTAWIALTGALHLDGLADTADAAIAPVSRERRLVIARDVAHGTFAVTAVVLLLLIKVSALAAMTRAEAVAVVAFAPAAGRAAAVIAMRTFAPARPDGMGALARAGATPLAVAACTVPALAIAGVALGWPGALAIGIGGAFALVVGAWIAGRMGGMTGDGYGAVVELAEAASLCAAAALLAHGHGNAWGWR